MACDRELRQQVDQYVAYLQRYAAGHYWPKYAKVPMDLSFPIEPELLPETVLENYLVHRSLVDFACIVPAITASCESPREQVVPSLKEKVVANTYPAGFVRIIEKVYERCLKKTTLEDVVDLFFTEHMTPDKIDHDLLELTNPDAYDTPYLRDPRNAKGVKRLIDQFQRYHDDFLQRTQETYASLRTIMNRLIIDTTPFSLDCPFFNDISVAIWCGERHWYGYPDYRELLKQR